MSSIKNIVPFGTKIYKKRYKEAFGSNPNKVTLDAVKTLLKDGLKQSEDKRLIYEITSNGRILYFFLSDVMFFGEHHKYFLTFPLIYCSNSKNARKNFYKALRSRCKEVARQEKTKDAAIWCHTHDKISINYFRKNSKFAALELAGDVNQTLKILKANKTHVIRKLKKGDVKKAAELEYRAHLSDKTSRMHTIVKKNKSKALKMFAGFCNNLLKQAHAFVSVDGKKVTGLGAIFPNKKRNSANVATIAIHPAYQGQGISKSLYIRMLSSIKADGIKKYMGHSTTKAVLGMATKMGRKELNRVYTFQI
jgi:hypothetical protein